MVNYYFFLNIFFTLALLVAYVQYHSINKKERYISGNKIKTDTKDHKKTLFFSLYAFKRIQVKYTILNAQNHPCWNHRSTIIYYRFHL
jgi:hypothetical protein